MAARGGINHVAAAMRAADRESCLADRAKRSRENAAMRKIVLTALSLAAGPALADQAACERIAAQAEKDQAHFFPREGYKVTGKGRLYFHFAPGKDCKTKDVFVITGDELIAYSEYKGWFSVMYANPGANQSFDGWVERNRLKFIGTMGPRY